MILDLWTILHFLPSASTACRQAGALCLYLIAHLPFECMAGDKTLFELLEMFRGERTRDDVLGRARLVWGFRGGGPLLLPPDPQDLSSLTPVVLDLWTILHFLHFLPSASTACRQAGALCLYLIAHLPFECMVGDKTLFEMLEMFRGDRTRDEVLGRARRVRGLKGGGTGEGVLIPRRGVSIGVSFGVFYLFPKVFACGGVGSIGLGYFQEGAVIVHTRCGLVRSRPLGARSLAS